MKEVKFCVICSVSDPKRVYITIPKNKERRATWFEHLGIVPTSRTKYVCEDHFDLKNDILNAEFITDFRNISTRKFVKDGVLPRLPDDYPNNSIFANKNLSQSKKVAQTPINLRTEAQCRACMKNSKMWKKLSGTFDDIETLTLLNAILECTSAQVLLDDTLPQQICRKCETELKNAYNFKKKVEESDNIFRNNTLFVDVKGGVQNEHYEVKEHKSPASVHTESEMDSEDDDEPLIFLKSSNKSKPNTEEDIFLNSEEIEGTNCDYEDIELLADEENIMKVVQDFDQIQSEIENLSENEDIVAAAAESVSNEMPKVKEKKQRKRPLDENGKPIPKRSQDIKLIPRTEIASLEPLEGLEIPYENQSGPFTCIFCKKIFPRYRTMLNHERDKHRTPVEARQCKICDKIMESRSSFKDHMNRKHLNVKKVQCDKCGLYIYNNRDYRQHMKTHFHSKDNGCRICFKTFDSQDLLREHKEKEHYNFVCTVCGNRYISQRNLKSHSLIHTGEKPFSCDLCEMKYSSLKNLKRHKEYTHECIKFPCFFCEQKFSRKQFLNKHVRLKHSTEDLTKMKFPHLYPHICGRCGKRFPEVQHLEIHDCVPSYFIHECDQCPARFPFHNHYRKHMSTHGVIIPNPRIRASTSKKNRDQEASVPLDQQ